MRTPRGFFFLAVLAGLAVEAAGGATPEAEVVKLAPVEVTASARWCTVSDSAGRVQLRAAVAGAPVRFARAGAELVPGETVTTGPRARLELLDPAGEGRWRLGGRTVFQFTGKGGRLLVGTALAVVPGGEVWTVDTFGSAARLHAGTWILQAMENEGLKVINLDGPARVEAEARGAAGAQGEVAEVRMRPGELIFLRPDGLGFGPLVTIYLEELLATSRLVRGFAEPLPRMARLVNQGVAQREQLKGVTGAFVAGAKNADGFQVVVPRGGAPE